jgi:hypothetical protein
MSPLLQNRAYLHERHRLSHQQIDRWLGEKSSKELMPEKLLQLKAVSHFLWVTDLFRENTIQCVCIKGPTLSYRIYGDPSVRYSHDIDLLIKPRQLEPALRLMEENHLQPIEAQGWPQEMIGQKLLLENVHHLALHHPERKINVEIHWVLTTCLPISQKELTEQTFRNLSSLSFAGRDFTVLNPEFELLFLIVHGTRHRWERLKWLVDISEYPLEKINSDALNQLIRKFQAERSLTLTNYYLKKYFGKELPFGEPVPLSPFLISYIQERIDGPVKTSYTFVENIKGFWYSWLLFPSITYKIKVFHGLFIRPGDITSHHFSFRFQYYLYRLYGLIKRRLFHV